MIRDDLGDFGDARLLEAMSQQPTISVHMLAKDRTRFLPLAASWTTRR